ncbi:class I SAM-dependent methyltransferase [Rhodococcus xishaensis]|uniref:Class I SAM-dependent methyltransferase n=1 Tax=Rhodococcus xishaensis TaxID=2487364 RepID=A0A3S3DXK3_9NOCA|nr:class I SAM-dependent methyltransferase [Rhodococcus xishaensis]RVW01327.1 class I SAM-dependent methyltransferase [Rhodococcus xishaensis]
MDAREWDERYSQTDMAWGAPPNPVVVEFVTSLPAGRALDLACGEGRHALWLATRGWQTTGVDFSSVAVARALQIAAQAPRSVRERLSYAVDDVTTTIALDGRVKYDLILMLHVHVEPARHRALVSRIIDALEPEGILIILDHETMDHAHGAGGLPDPELLYTPADLADEVDGRLDVAVAERRYRDTDGGTAIDALLVARRPVSWQLT